MAMAGEILPVSTPMQYAPIRSQPVAASGPSAQSVEIFRDIFRLTRGRLVIEQDPETQRWVYRTFDPATGQVLSQFPVKRLLEPRPSGSVVQGVVFNALV
jgi:hypothetical protein